MACGCADVGNIQNRSIFALDCLCVKSEERCVLEDTCHPRVSIFAYLMWISYPSGAIQADTQLSEFQTNAIANGKETW